jgi:metal-responsive CopG/Arc/MetJ family transcriptional regulator
VVGKTKRRTDYVAARGRKQITAELPLDVVTELDRIATDEDVARATVILWAVRDYVAKYPRLAQARALVG